MLMTKIFLQFVLIGFILCSPSSLAQELPVQNLSSPRATMNYFLKSMKAYKLGNNKGLELAMKAFYANEIPNNIKEVKVELPNSKSIANRLLIMQHLSRLS